MHKKTLSTTIALIIMIAFAGIFLYYAKTHTVSPNVSESSDETHGAQVMTDTSSWQTYKNEEYGFEMKYPEECSVDFQKTLRLENMKNYAVGGKLEDSEYDAILNIRSQKNNKNSSYIIVYFTNFYDISKEYFGCDNAEGCPLAIKKIDIAGREAVIADGSNNPDNRMESDFLKLSTMKGHFVFSLKEKPNNWGVYNVFDIYVAEGDEKIVHEILKSSIIK